MSKYDIYHIKLSVCGLLLIALLMGPCLAQDIIIEKNVIGQAPYHIGDPVTWNISITNNETDPVNVTVEDIGLKNWTSITGTPTLGDFNESTSVWTITGLKAGETANLTLVATFSYAEDQINTANITLVNESAPESTLQDSAERVSILLPELSATMEIKPETLNLKSKGAFTVFINVSEGVQEDKKAIDLEHSTLKCNDSVLRKVILTGEGDMIAKFDRMSLNVTKNESVTISCIGDIVINGSHIHVAGSDQIRVINEKPLDTIIDKLLKFLGLKIAESDAITNQALIDSIPDPIKNMGQAKQFLKENWTKGNAIGTLGEEESDIQGGKPEKEPKDNKPPVTECNQGNCKGGKK